MIGDVRAKLGELAALADCIDRDERRILDAAMARLDVVDDEEERRVLGEVIDRARAVLCGDPARKMATKNRL